jgi:uncharacterized membrane protein
MNSVCSCRPSSAPHLHYERACTIGTVADAIAAVIIVGAFIITVLLAELAWMLNH